MQKEGRLFGYVEFADINYFTALVNEVIDIRAPVEIG